MKIISFLSVITFIGAAIQASHQADVEVELLEHLFNKSVYGKLARPVDDQGKPVEVKFGISLQGIDYVDMEKDVITLQLWLNYEWKDHKLSWDPMQYGQVESIRLPTDMIWIPDIMLYNSANEDFANLVHHTQVVTYPDGTCSWVPAGTHVVACSMDAAWFPFDEHICVLKFGSWTHHGASVNVTSRSDSWDMSTYSMHKLWEVTDTKAKRNVVQYACCPEPYIDITFEIRFRRRSLHDSLLVFLPPSLLTLLSLFSFSLPVTCGERITMGTLQLVTLGLLWFHLSESLIPQAYSITLADVFFATMFTASFVSFALTVQIHRMFYKTTPMPNVLKSVVAFLARLTCFSDKCGSDYEDLKGQPRASFDGDTARIHVNKDDVDVRAGWVLASRVLDRFFGFLFLIFFILTCIILFASIPRG